MVVQLSPTARGDIIARGSRGRNADAVTAILKFLRRLARQRTMVWAIARREMQTRYAGTLAGLIWSMVHPLMMILIYWFVFSVGLRIQPSGNVPFIILFLCGLIPWTAFSETLSASIHAVTANAHLVKKTVFSTEILPVAHLAASMVSQAIMLVILVVLLVAHGMPLSIYNLQFLYFLAALSVFSLGLAWLVAALNVFYRDVGQIVSVVLNMWFWMTPIVWQLEKVPEAFRFYIKLNPLYYIVAGYRASFLHHTGFWVNWRLGAYFWAAAVLMFCAGGWVFRRLKPQFAEVL